MPIKWRLGMTWEQIVNSPKPVLVDFYAEWCGPCKMMAPVLKETKESIGDSGHIIKVDIDKHPDLATQYQIKGVPTFMIFKSGKSHWRQSGMISKNELLQLFHEFM